MDNYLEGIIKEIKQHKNRPKELLIVLLIKKIDHILILKESVILL